MTAFGLGWSVDWAWRSIYPELSTDSSLVYFFPFSTQQCTVLHGLKSKEPLMYSQVLSYALASLWDVGPHGRLDSFDFSAGAGRGQLAILFKI